MTTMGISEFKAKCIATVKRINKRREPVLLTIRGEPVAEVRPLPTTNSRRLGIHEGRARGADVPVHEDSAGEWMMNRSAADVLGPSRGARRR